ncbi:MAG: hypothetical protein CL681_02360 [Blastopirellula sp.]|nr:hypothetical protein [Blastopirellula sp.]
MLFPLKLHMLTLLLSWQQFLSQYRGLYILKSPKQNIPVQSVSLFIHLQLRLQLTLTMLSIIWFGGGQQLSYFHFFLVF